MTTNDPCRLISSEYVASIHEFQAAVENFEEVQALNPSESQILEALRRLKKAKVTFDLKRKALQKCQEVHKFEYCGSVKLQPSEERFRQNNYFNRN